MYFIIGWRFYISLVFPQGIAGFQKTLEDVKAEGGTIEFGGRVLDDREGNFVEPAIVTGLKHDSPVVHR